jgi:hypothetical protein
MSATVRVGALVLMISAYLVRSVARLSARRTICGGGRRWRRRRRGRGAGAAGTGRGRQGRIIGGYWLNSRFPDRWPDTLHCPRGAVTTTNLGGHITGDLAAIATQRGTVAVYAVGTNADLYTYYQTGPGSGFKGPKRLTASGGPTSTPAVVQAANGVISVYTRTGGGAVRAVWQNAGGGAVTKTRNLGAHVAASPAAIVTARDTIAVYAVGTNKRLYGYQQPRPGGPFTGPTKLTSNGGLTGTPVAIPNANGAVSAYVRTTGGSIRGKAQSAAVGAFKGTRRSAATSPMTWPVWSSATARWRSTPTEPTAVSTATRTPAGPASPAGRCSDGAFRPPAPRNVHRMTRWPHQNPK